jgi:hypothetical protein
MYKLVNETNPKSINNNNYYIIAVLVLLVVSFIGGTLVVNADDELPEIQLRIVAVTDEGAQGTDTWYIQNQNNYDILLDDYEISVTYNGDKCQDVTPPYDKTETCGIIVFDELPNIVPANYTLAVELTDMMSEGYTMPYKFSFYNNLFDADIQQVSMFSEISHESPIETHNLFMPLMMAGE